MLSFSASMTAHVTFAGGGLVLPARTAYDRQLLRDHILNSLRREDEVLISVGAETWTVERPIRGHRPNCEGCRRQLAAAVLHKADTDASYCVACALA